MPALPDFGRRPLCFASFVVALLISAEGASAFQNQPSDSFWWFPKWREPGDCGPVALHALLKLQGKNCSLSEVKAKATWDPVYGCSLKELQSLGAKFGCELEARYIQPSQISEIPRPFLFHGVVSEIKEIGHFGLVLDYDDKRSVFMTLDPTLELIVESSSDSLASNFSGYYLAPKISTQHYYDRLSILAILCLVVVAVGLVVATQKRNSGR